MRTSVRAAAIAALASMSTSSVWAAAQSTASVDGLTFTLYDINANDGIDSTFSLLSSQANPGTTSTSVSVNDNSLPESGSEALSRATAFQSHTSGVAITNGQAYATAMPYEVAAFGQSVSSSGNYGASASTTLGKGSSYANGIELSANSILVIQATAHVTASVTPNASCSSYYYCYSYDTGSGSVSMSINYNFGGGSGSGSGSGSFSDGLSGSASMAGNGSYVYDPVLGYSTWVYSTPASSFDQTKLMTVVFANNTNQTQYATFSLSASVSGNSATAANGLSDVPISIVPDGISATGSLSQIGDVAGGKMFGISSVVPEAESWAMMALGLVGLGVIARRRQA